MTESLALPYIQFLEITFGNKLQELQSTLYNIQAQIKTTINLYESNRCPKIQNFLNHLFKYIDDQIKEGTKLLVSSDELLAKNSSCSDKSVVIRRQIRPKTQPSPGYVAPKPKRTKVQPVFRKISHVLNPQQDIQFYQDANQGKSVQYLVQKYKVSRSTVLRRLKNTSRTIPVRPPQLTYEQLNERVRQQILTGQQNQSQYNLTTKMKQINSVKSQRISNQLNSSQNFSFSLEQQLNQIAQQEQ